MILSPTPHVKTARTTKHIMADVCLALVPAGAMGIFYFGFLAAAVIAVAVLSAVLTEFIWYVLSHKIWRDAKGVLKDFFRQFDFTSCVTGLLLAYSLPAKTECVYLVILGSFFAVGIVKMLFGGTGKNVVNPAVAGRIFLFLSFSVAASSTLCRIGPVLDGTAALSTGATQLTNLLNGDKTLSPLDLFLGTGVAGCIGETCKLALLIGYGYLVIRRVVKWYLPPLLVLAEGLFAVALGAFDFALFLPSVLSGGLMLGAIFMATDYVTSPKSRLGNLVYFPALGLLTAALRKATGIEIFSFALLLANFAVFLIDLATVCRPFGYRRKKTKEVEP